MAGPIQATRVVKKLSASQPGALKLARRFGDSLVCVRYRHDLSGRQRYTTVELIVDSGPLAASSAAAAERIVTVRIDFTDTPRQRQARANGAKWDSKACVWRMSRQLARQLGLTAAIVRK